MAAKPVRFHEGAAQDLERATRWYRERSLPAAQAFVHEVEHSIDEIVKAPDRWPAGTLGTRRFTLQRFPFSIIYSEERETVIVWAVAHGSRRPDFWGTRVKE